MTQTIKEFKNELFTNIKSNLLGFDFTDATPETIIFYGALYSTMDKVLRIRLLSIDNLYLLESITASELSTLLTDLSERSSFEEIIRNEYCRISLIDNENSISAFVGSEIAIKSILMVSGFYTSILNKSSALTQLLNSQIAITAIANNTLENIQSLLGKPAEVVASSIAVTTFTGNQSLSTLIMNNDAVRVELARNQPAMAIIAGSQIAMTVFVGLSNEKMMDFLNSTTAVSALVDNQNAVYSIIDNNTTYTNLLSNNANFSYIVASTLAMTKIISIDTAFVELLSHAEAIALIIANQSALTQISNDISALEISAQYQDFDAIFLNLSSYIEKLVTVSAWMIKLINSQNKLTEIKNNAQYFQLFVSSTALETVFIPSLFSNVTELGTAFSSHNENISFYYVGYQNGGSVFFGTSSVYFGFEFIDPVFIHTIVFNNSIVLSNDTPKHIKFQYSADGYDWHDAHEITDLQTVPQTPLNIPIAVTGKYKHWRFNILSNNGGNNISVALGNNLLGFYYP